MSDLREERAMMLARANVDRATEEDREEAEEGSVERNQSRADHERSAK